MVTFIHSHLDGVVGIQERFLTADAAVDAAQRHVQAEGEEVPMVEMTHAVVQPGWKHVQFNKERKREMTQCLTELTTINKER